VSFRPLSPYPERWTDEDRDAYKAAYLAGENVVPTPLHEFEECDFCDALRELRKEADDEYDERESKHA
jgi:hypothetical protein